MTENKRFTFADGFKIVAIRDNGEIMNSKEVCNKLNGLYEENNEFKINEEFKNKAYSDLLDNFTQLKKKYQKSKKENKELKGLIDLFAQDICDLTELLCKNNIDYKLHSDVTNFIVKWGIRID